MSEMGTPRFSMLTRLLVFLGILLGVWFSSLRIYDAEKTRDAARDRQAVLNGESPFNWAFSTRWDIDGGHGVRRFDWNGETVAGDGEGLYFYLNMQGRMIDARQHTTIRIRVYSGQESRLRLYHHQLAEGFIHAARPVPVRAGWQVLELDLGNLAWFSKELAHPDHPDMPSSWGGTDGVVTALRVDPVANGGFEVDYVVLPLAPGGSYDPAVRTFEGKGDEIFTQMRRSGNHNRLLARNAWLRTPESSAWQRRQIAREFPGAIVFPRPPSTAELDVTAFRAEPAAGLWAALLVAAVALAVFMRRREERRWLSVSELLALLLLVGTCVYWYPELSRAWRLMLAVPLALAIWWLRPASPRTDLFGDRQAWLMLAPLMIVPLGLLFLVEGQDLDTARLARILGVYFPWALLQQYLVASLVFRRLQLLHAGTAGLLAAAVFAFLHLPNFGLMIATFLLGNLWLYIFRRHGNLLAIAVSHAVLAVCAEELLPAYLLVSKNVGVAYLANL